MWQISGGVSGQRQVQPGASELGVQPNGLAQGSLRVIVTVLCQCLSALPVAGERLGILGSGALNKQSRDNKQRTEHP